MVEELETGGGGEPGVAPVEGGGGFHLCACGEQGHLQLLNGPLKPRT